MVENLKPVRTEEEAREKGRRGGIASGEARREKATLLKWAMALRDAPNPDRKKETDGETQGAAVIVSMYREGRHGNVQAAKFLSDLMRETESAPAVAVVSPIKIELPNQSRLDEIAKRREERNARDERELNGR